MCHLQGTGFGVLHCPPAAPIQGVVPCTYEQWLEHCSPRRTCCQLPDSERGIQRFLQFRLGCHGLPIAAGHLAGAGLNGAKAAPQKHGQHGLAELQYWYIVSI